MVSKPSQNSLLIRKLSRINIFAIQVKRMTSKTQCTMRNTRLRWTTFQVSGASKLRNYTGLRSRRSFSILLTSIYIAGSLTAR